MVDPAKLLGSAREADWRKGAAAILAKGGARVAFAPFLRPQAIVDDVAVRRATVIIEAMHAALETGKTNEKRTLALPKGPYLVEHFYRNEPWLWLVRLTRQ